MSDADLLATIFGSACLVLAGWLAWEVRSHRRWERERAEVEWRHFLEVNRDR